jgi:hypothetical protein
MQHGKKRKVKATIRWRMYMAHRLVEHCNKVKAQYGLVNYVLILTILIHVSNIIFQNHHLNKYTWRYSYLPICTLNCSIKPFHFPQRRSKWCYFIYWNFDLWYYFSAKALEMQVECFQGSCKEEIHKLQSSTIDGKTYYWALMMLMTKCWKMATSLIIAWSI